MMLQLLVLCTLISASLAVDCDGLEDGSHFVSCKSYVVCENGVAEQKHCEPGFVFSDVTDSCENEADVGPPCGLVRDCTGVANGKYPDHETDCTSYYTCQNNVYFGHNYCPEGLKFSTDHGTCVWPYEACTPCGTKEC